MGSIWRRWDLHIHDPLSKLGNPFPGVSWEEYVDTLESSSKANEIAVIGITDYMTFDGYEKLLEDKSKNARLESVSLLIPNIEFRMLSSTTDEKAINLHVLVDPSENDHVERIKDLMKNLRSEYDGQIYGCFKSDVYF